MTQPRIMNFSKSAIQSGAHWMPEGDTVLIQIANRKNAVVGDIPEPRLKFTERHSFHFDDLEEGQDDQGFVISDDQAKQIVEILFKALGANQNVVVHCHAGICRSGAVTEVGVAIGFKDGNTHRIPNLTVKRKLMIAASKFMEDAGR